MREIDIKKLLDQWKSKERDISKNKTVVIKIKNLAFLLIWFPWVGYKIDVSQSTHNLIWTRVRHLKF